MKKTDILQRFIFDNAPIRGEYIHLHHSYQTILEQHPYPPPLRRLLGEALCVAGMLSAIIKFEGRLTVQFRGHGKLKLLLAQCNSQFEMRGLAKWEDDLTEADLEQSFHQGVLVIMLDAAANKAPYQGIVNWRGASLAESIQGYFQESEQLATKLWLTVEEKSAAGLLLQIIPANEKGLSTLEQEIVMPQWQEAVNLTDKSVTDHLCEDDFQTLIQHVYPNQDIRIFPEQDLSFRCTCSRSRGEEAILLLGREEAFAELKNKKSIVVTCDFCNTRYIYDKNEVEDLFKKDKPTTLH
jgi:molecular chaperone Hsp33